MCAVSRTTQTSSCSSSSTASPGNPQAKVSSAGVPASGAPPLDGADGESVAEESEDQDECALGELGADEAELVAGELACDDQAGEVVGTEAGEGRVTFDVAKQQSQRLDWLHRGNREPLASMGIYHYAMFVYSASQNAMDFDDDDFVVYRFADTHPQARSRVQKLRVSEVFKVPRLFGLTLSAFRKSPHENTM